MTARDARTPGGRPTLVQLAAFEGLERTSFVRMLQRVFAEAARRDWHCVLVLPEVSVTASWALELAAAGVAVEAAPAEKGPRKEWIGELADRAPGPVVLHCHFTDFDLAAAAVAAARPDVEAVWHFHTVLESSPRALARQVAKLAVARYRGVAAIACPSEAMRAALLRRGAPRSRVRVCQTAIDPDDFPPPVQGERAAARERLGLPPEVPVLFHFGWDWRLKGGDRLLDVVARLREEGVEAVGVTRAGVEAEAEIEAAGLAGAVRVQPPYPEIRDLYVAADVLMATSRGEGLPFTVLEALCLGTPVVATDIPGHRIVAAAPNCCVVTGGEAELAAATREALERRDPERAADAVAGREWVAARFSLDAYARATVDIYGELVRA